MDAQLETLLEQDWRFQSFGGELMLVTDGNGGKVVLAVAPAGPNKGSMTARDTDGRLTPLRADHPVGRFLMAMPALVEAVRLAGHIRPENWNDGDDRAMIWVYERLDAALAAAGVDPFPADWAVPA